MRDEAVAELVNRTTRSSGVPERVEDGAVAEQIARLLSVATDMSDASDIDERQAS